MTIYLCAKRTGKRYGREIAEASSEEQNQNNIFGKVIVRQLPDHGLVAAMQVLRKDRCSTERSCIYIFHTHTFSYFSFHFLIHFISKSHTTTQKVHFAEGSITAEPWKGLKHHEHRVA